MSSLTAFQEHVSALYLMLPLFNVAHSTDHARSFLEKYDRNTVLILEITGTFSGHLYWNSSRKELNMYHTVPGLHLIQLDVTVLPTIATLKSLPAMFAVPLQKEPQSDTSVLPGIFVVLPAGHD